MSYTALYRKFRPDNFGDVKGQDHIVTTLKNQLKANRIGHAYLFTGTRGTGKTSVAKIFAKAVNCENPGENGPCGGCATCKAIASGSSMNVIEIDAASNNGVDNIREIVEEVSYSPAEGRYKVYIIDEVHMLSIGAFNALLKTLEEPPSYVIFILATTEVHKLPITILSRCQRYDFKRITIDTIASRMKDLCNTEGISVEDRALRYIAKVADGSMRDGLSLLDQCIAFNLGEELTYEKTLDVLGAVDTEVFSRLIRSVLDRNVSGCIAVLDEIIMQGREITQFVTDITWYLRNLLLVSCSDNIEDVIDMSSDNLAKLKEEAELMEQDQIIRYIHIFSELSGKIKYAVQKRILVEIALIKLCVPQTETTDEAFRDRVRAVEEKLEKGIVVTGAVTPVPGTTTPVPNGSKERPKLPTAIPADVEQIVKNWRSYLGDMDAPMRMHLKNVHLSLGADGKLMLVFEGDEGDYFAKNENTGMDRKTDLQNFLTDRVGKEIEVIVQNAGSAMEIAETYPDLFAEINMEVEEED